MTERCENCELLIEKNNLLRRALQGSRDDLILYGEAFGLTSSEAKIFGILIRRKVASIDDIMMILYHDQPNDWPDENCLAVMVHKLRRKLEKHGAKIHSKRGSRQYKISRPDAVRLVGVLMDAENNL